MRRFLLTVAAVSAIIICGIVAIVCAIENQRCYSRWMDSVYESRWTLFAGCQLKLTHDRWVPAESVRVFK